MMLLEVDLKPNMTKYSWFCRWPGVHLQWGFFQHHDSCLLPGWSTPFCSTSEYFWSVTKLFYYFRLCFSLSEWEAGPGLQQVFNYFNNLWCLTFYVLSLSFFTTKKLFYFHNHCRALVVGISEGTHCLCGFDYERKLAAGSKQIVLSFSF